MSGFEEGSSHAAGWVALARNEGIEVMAALSGPLALDDVAAPSETVWVVLGMERRYSEPEVTAVRAFLGSGGNLVVADAGGFGNQLAADEPVRFGPSRLLDERFQDDPSFVVADATVGASAHRLLLNHPVALLPADGFAGEILVASSEASYVDANANGVIDDADVPGPFPVAALWSHPGGGRVLFSSDVGIFLDNRMNAEGYTHAAFHRDLLRVLLPEGGQVLLDEGVHAPSGAAGALGKAQRLLSHVEALPVAVVSVLVVACLMLAIPSTVRGKQPWRRHAADERPMLANRDDDAFPVVLRGLVLASLARATGTPQDVLAAEGHERASARATDPLQRRALQSPASLSDAEVERLLQTLDPRGA